MTELETEVFETAKLLAALKESSKTVWDPASPVRKAAAMVEAKLERLCAELLKDNG